MTQSHAAHPASSVVLTPVKVLADAARAYLAAEAALDPQPDDEAARCEAEQLVGQARMALITALCRIEGRR